MNAIHIYTTMIKVRIIASEFGTSTQDEQWKKKLKPAENNAPLVVAVYNSGAAPAPNSVTPVVPAAAAASPVKAAPSPVRTPSPTKVVD